MPVYWTGHYLKKGYLIVEFVSFQFWVLISRVPKSSIYQPVVCLAHLIFVIHISNDVCKIPLTPIQCKSPTLDSQQIQSNNQVPTHLPMYNKSCLKYRKDGKYLAKYYKWDDRNSCETTNLRKNLADYQNPLGLSYFYCIPILPFLFTDVFVLPAKRLLSDTNMPILLFTNRWTFKNCKIILIIFMI